MEIGPGYETDHIRSPTRESKATVEAMKETIFSIISAKPPLQRRTLTFGGDHLIALPILQAYVQHFKRPVAMIHFDAHTDTYKPAVDGMFYDHGTMFYRERMEGTLIFEQSVQVSQACNFLLTCKDRHPNRVRL